MNWKLKNIKKETDHPFLNFYTVTYEVDKDGLKYDYSYFMSSRNSEENLVCKTQDTSQADGVLMPLYYVNPETKEISLLITKQFRPALNKYVSSFPAGLIDPNETIETTAHREALEEAGAIIDDLELICPPSPTSSGLTDELNAIMMARITGFKSNELEMFEDINTELVPLKDIEKYMESHFFAMQIRLVIKYILLRFKGQY
jgi:ADP-ribose pyrophosphatase